MSKEPRRLAESFVHLGLGATAVPVRASAAEERVREIFFIGSSPNNQESCDGPTGREGEKQERAAATRVTLLEVHCRSFMPDPA